MQLRLQKCSAVTLYCNVLRVRGFLMVREDISMI